MMRDLRREAVFFFMMFDFTALSMTEVASRTRASRSSGGAVSARLIAVATFDFAARLRSFSFFDCLSLLIVDFLCGKWIPPVWPQVRPGRTPFLCNHTNIPITGPPVKQTFARAG